MRTRDNKNGYKIIETVYESEVNGIGFRQLSRKTGLYQKSLSSWLKYLIELNIIKKDLVGRIHLTDDAIKKYNTNTLIIPQDPRSKKVKNNQRKQFNIKELGENYREIIILILCLAAFGSKQPREYKKSKLGLMIVRNPIDSQQTYMYGATQPLTGIGLSDLINKLPIKSSNSPNKKAFLPKYYTNYDNNELFGYLRLSHNNAQKYITLLSKYKVLIKIRKIKKDSETRYKISGKRLNEFVQKCILAFHSDVNQRLEYAYICDFLEKKQKKEYIKFLKKWYGRNRKYSNVISYINRTKDTEIDNISKIHYRKYIEECDKDIFHYELFESKIMKYKYDEFTLIIGKKYKPLQTKYLFIINSFFDMLFPQFLRKIWYYQKNAKNKIP